MAELDMQRRSAPLEQRARASRSPAGSTPALSGPGPTAVLSLKAALDNSPRVVAQRQAGEQLNRPNRTGLPDRTKAGVEALSGLSMDHVRVHYNSPAPAQLNAHAFTQGSDIHVAPGQEKHVAHEAWHVVQQAQGRVRATRQMAGGQPLNDDPGLEREADRMGAEALRTASLAAPKPVQRVAAPVVQRYTIEHDGKLSQTGAIFLADGDNLFAADAQFDQANGIEGGGVVFNKGPANPHYEALHRVQAAYRDADAEPKSLNITAAHTPTAERIMRDELTRMVRNHADTLALIAAADDMDDDQKEDTYGTTDRDEIIDSIVMDQTDELTDQLEADLKPRRKEVLAASPILEAFNRYTGQQLQLVFSRSAKIAIQSDCGQAAALISPHGAQSAAAANAGDVYALTPHMEQRGQAEWEHHFAAVIMHDGADHVTMESAAARASDGYSKMPHDRTWTYAMYGPEEGQSFEAVHRPNLGGEVAQQKAAGPAPVQRVFTYKAAEYKGGAVPARLPHSVKAKDAERLSRAERDFGELTDRASFDTAFGSLAPGEGEPVSAAELERRATMKPYIDLLPHLAGEEDGTEGKGGHLLSTMQAKWGRRLHVAGDADAAAVWTCEWNLLKDPDKAAEESNLAFSTAKFSTMFPSGWSEADLRAQLMASSASGRGRELQPSGIKVTKSGDTFYPVLE